VYAMITFVSAVVARAYGALHCLDIYFIVVKKIPKKYFVLIASERCVAMRIDREDLPRSFNDKLESMILVIWEYSTDKLSLIFILIIVEEINFLHCLGSGCFACLLRYSFYIVLSLDAGFALGLKVYAMITFVSAVVARAYGALHCFVSVITTVFANYGSVTRFGRLSKWLCRHRHRFGGRCSFSLVPR